MASSYAQYARAPVFHWRHIRLEDRKAPRSTGHGGEASPGFFKVTRGSKGEAVGFYIGIGQKYTSCERLP